MSTSFPCCICLLSFRVLSTFRTQSHLKPKSFLMSFMSTKRSQMIKNAWRIQMPREPIPSHFFTITVVRKGHRFLLVKEQRGQWYFPGGGVLPREDLFQAAHRETFEEATVPIFIEGIYRIEYIANPDSTSRFRVIFTGRPVDDTAPKSQPDEETLAAEWFTFEEIQKLSLRSSEVITIIDDILNGATIFPTNLLVTNPLKVKNL